MSPIIQSLLISVGALFAVVAQLEFLRPHARIV